MKLRISTIVNYLEKNVGEEMTPAQLFHWSGAMREDAISQGDLFDEVQELFRIAEAHGFILDNSAYAMSLIGLPKSIPFVIRKKRNRKS